MACRIASFLMTLSDLQGHLPIASLFQMQFSYNCAEFKKFQLTWRVARSLCDSWAPCSVCASFCLSAKYLKMLGWIIVKLVEAVRTLCWKQSNLGLAVWLGWWRSPISEVILSTSSLYWDGWPLAVYWLDI